MFEMVGDLIIGDTEGDSGQGIIIFRKPYFVKMTSPTPPTAGLLPRFEKAGPSTGSG